ncbi:MAG: DNA-processing protein DprA [Candidatus Nitrospinota bacterium M3_3B_026]
MTEERICRIALNTLPPVGPVTYHRLIGAFGSARDVFRAEVEELSRINGLSPAAAETIRRADPEAATERELALARKTGASIVLLGEEGYPKPLENAYSPPPVLSIMGEWREEDSAAIAIVGSRTPSRYGRVMTEKMARELSAAGVTIVSGLARGVDGVAHRAALDAGGRTIAVLGCGLNVYYPAEHKGLQRAIAGNGAVISQFPFTARPDKANFPMRNRVISGLSLGVFVTEAAEKSGALITAYAAIDDNRDVFSLPGQANSPKSRGTNSLIKLGHAKLIQDVGDILEELPDYVKKSIMERQAALPLPEEELSGDEAKVLAALGHEPAHMDAVAEGLGLPSNMVSAILLSLELKGLVKQTPGRLFIKL